MEKRTVWVEFSAPKIEYQYSVELLELETSTDEFPMSDLLIKEQFVGGNGLSSKPEYYSIPADVKIQGKEGIDAFIRKLAGGRKNLTKSILADLREQSEINLK